MQYNDQRGKDGKGWENSLWKDNYRPKKWKIIRQIANKGKHISMIREVNANLCQIVPSIRKTHAELQIYLHISTNPIPLWSSSAVIPPLSRHYSLFDCYSFCSTILYVESTISLDHHSDYYPHISQYVLLGDFFFWIWGKIMEGGGGYSSMHIFGI